MLLSGFARSENRFDVCPDTAITVVLRRRQPGEISLGATGPRCGTRSTEPCTDEGGIRFIAISSGQVHSCGISVDSVAYCWGDGRNGQLGNGRREIFRFPQRVLGKVRFASIGAGSAFACARTATGEVHCWGSERAVPGWPNQPEGPVRVALDKPATSLTVGRRHACVLDSSGIASCWGWNVDGETGTGTSGIDAAMVASPTPVATDARFTSLSAGSSFTCGITAEANVLCWGSNVDHVLGRTAPERCGHVASVSCSSRPVPITLPERITQLSSGTGHVCALSERSTVLCWGVNTGGQAGVFTPNVPAVPTPVAVTLNIGPVTAISSGAIQTCALTSSQKVFCWGADYTNYGRDAATTDLSPRPFAEGIQLRAISAGQIHVCGIETGGRLRCWGDTILGALGVR